MNKIYADPQIKQVANRIKFL